jgi:FkbM family methyltransferase
MGLYNREFCKKLHNGSFFMVRPSEHIQQQLFWYGYYEKEAILTWEQMIPADAVVLDIGANTGYYSIIAAKKSRHTYAFEPGSSNRKKLEENVTLNLLANVSILPYAVSDKPGKGELHMAGDDNTGMNSLEQMVNSSGSKEPVNMITIDNWVAENRITGISLVKIDVEGAEMKVLKGMRAIIEEQKPVIFMEVIGQLLMRSGHSVAEIYDFLSVKGYTAYEIIKPLRLKQISAASEGDSIVFAHASTVFPAAIGLE